MSQDQRRVLDVMKLTNYYMLPFAVVLILLGILLGRPSARQAQAALAAVTITTIGNLLIVETAHRRQSAVTAMRKLRIGFNYSFNVLLVYLLLPVWRPIWLLFLLTAIVVAVFEDRKSTLAHALLFSAMLFGTAHFRGMLDASVAGELACYSMTLALVGFFINHLLRSQRS